MFGTYNRLTKEERARMRLGMQCPECHGVHVESLPRQPHDPRRFQCLECGCQWRSDAPQFAPMNDGRG